MTDWNISYSSEETFPDVLLTISTTLKHPRKHDDPSVPDQLIPALEDLLPLLVSQIATEKAAGK